MLAVIHCNPAIHWQVKYSKALQLGLLAEGIKSNISNKKTQRGDLTIVLGPHWCAEYHPDCLYIDRAFWGDPEAVSIHWRVSGEKVYHWQAKDGRPYPKLKPMKKGGRCLVLCDYGKQYDYQGTIRKHPTEQPSVPLIEALEKHDIAIGGRSTALVDAAIYGLKVITLEKNTPVDPISDQDEPDRESWLKALSWHNWTYHEIKKGEPWAHILKLKP